MFKFLRWRIPTNHSIWRPTPIPTPQPSIQSCATQRSQDPAASICYVVRMNNQFRVTVESNTLDELFTAVNQYALYDSSFLNFMCMVCDVCIIAHNPQPYPRRRSCWRQWVCRWTSSRPQPAWRGGCWRPRQANTANLTHPGSCSVRAGSTQQYLEQPGGGRIGRKYKIMMIFSIQLDMRQSFSKSSDYFGCAVFFISTFKCLVIRCEITQPWSNCVCMQERTWHSFIFRCKPTRRRSSLNLSFECYNTNIYMESNKANTKL